MTGRILPKEAGAPAGAPRQAPRRLRDVPEEETERLISVLISGKIRSMVMKKQKKTARVLITIPVELLKKIDALAKKANMNRGAYVCAVVESKFFADEMKEAQG